MGDGGFRRLNMVVESVSARGVGLFGSPAMEHLGRSAAFDALL